MLKHEAFWHNLKDDPQDKPTKTHWFVVKVKSSDNLRVIYGHETINADNYDAWMIVDCPY